MSPEEVERAATSVLADVLLVAFERRLPEYAGQHDAMYAMEAAQVDLAEALVALLPGGEPRGDGGR